MKLQNIMTLPESLTEHLNPKLNYGAEPFRAPTLKDGDKIIYDECGRIIGDVTYQSHWFRVVENFGANLLLVRHGAGEERIPFDHHLRRAVGLEKLNTHERYLMLHTFYRIHSSAYSDGARDSRSKIFSAFDEGRLKKRKLRGQPVHKVWIEPKHINAERVA